MVVFVLFLGLGSKTVNVSGLSACPGTSPSPSLIGTEQADKLIGNANSESICGGEGNDYIDALAGDDRVFGGDGTDLYIWKRGQRSYFRTIE